MTSLEFSTDASLKSSTVAVANYNEVINNASVINAFVLKSSVSPN